MMTTRAAGSRLAVIGAGAWGTTLANLLAGKDDPVNLWVYEPDLAERMLRHRENDLYLPGVPLHPHLHPTPDLTEVVRDAGTFISVLPSHIVRSLWGRLAPLVPAGALVVSATKGIDAESLCTMSRVLQDVMAPDKQVDIAALSGPTFAREVSRQIPSAVVAAAATVAVAEEVQLLFNTPVFRVYTNTDVLGVELGGALKNVMALAAGVCDGLQFGYNARAALITRGLAEIAQLGVAMGARAQTFAGLSGMGDLVLTCTGDLSRNHTVGVQLGQGKSLDDILAGMNAVAEGVTTAGSAVALGRKYQVEMPISERVYALLNGEVTPHEAVNELMTRTLKSEDGSAG
jgi:glycerol-3-phosphate dehydrogenase (NAD(P)+)